AFILTSAGVSVGTYDFVRRVVEENGTLNFWRVNMRPGKPLAFGLFKNIPFIGLPGNPVSSFVGFTVFVVPILKKLSGLPPTPPPPQTAILEEAIESDGRESYLRGNVTLTPTGYRAKLEGHQGSGNLTSLSKANALLILPSGVKSLPAGTEVNFWFIR
ncbi:molybdopterin-binding protein, partial [Anaerolinea sp.]